ncbi:MAG: D-tyrosyl-tRNA deacylase [Omnitrophica WOR_2 bacterium SM23_72]|nr:MAG: D-tyrosyl-tRNA deacylase [Omnitrophica WOR_2 bacterium SM23_72]
MAIRKFDLNIEKILEDWEAHDAIREIIANALDEQMLTKTKDFEIFKDSAGKWHIKDYGRGIRYEHLTQNENTEKLSNPNLIGKFGIGLKDALATLNRKKINVLIKSRYGEITLGESQKHDFEDILTLHAYISLESDPNFVGTEFVLDNINDEEVEKAKNLFFKFSKEKTIESTIYGAVLEKKGEVSKIYLNGVKVAEEDKFLFSYNITSLDSKIRKALNRERSNVGRSAYSDRVRAILIACKSEEVARILSEDLKNYSTGLIHDELKWLDVQEHATKILSSSTKSIFLTPEEIINTPDFVEKAKTDGYEIVTIPEKLKDKVHGATDISGEPIRDLEQFHVEYSESFEYKFVDLKDLTEHEKKIFSFTDNILNLIGGKPANVNSIKISETMRKELSLHETTGVWDAGLEIIIIKRSQLESLEKYAGTLLHEIGHAISGICDVTRGFEEELTRIIGILCTKLLKEESSTGTFFSKLFKK